MVTCTRIFFMSLCCINKTWTVHIVKWKTYCKILARQGGQGPGWHNSTHLWGQTPSLVLLLWLLLLLYLRGFPQTSPHECGISRLSNGGSIIFAQKHRYSLGVAFLTNWHPGHLQPPSSVLDDESFDHFLIQWMWKTWKHSPSLEKEIS